MQRAAPNWLRRTRLLVQPGHHSSPLPDVRAVRARQAEIFAVPPHVPGVDLQSEPQLALVPVFAELAAELPYHPDQPGDPDRDAGLRYRLANPWFAHGDGVALYCWLRRLRPHRYLEIGSGWSSALALDVNERYLGGTMRCTFVDPHPQRLLRLLRPGDAASVTVVPRPLHAAPPDLFTQLTPGDVLFIDSSHVSRVGSDVNQLLLDIVPALPPGVFVHLHDIFYPFEYPREWVYQGRPWNESYLLRALLINNSGLRIRWFNSYLDRLHRARVGAAIPAWDRGPGSSIWLETTTADR